MRGRKINEIFYSLQGEGYNTGKAAVFIRFSGCNLRCEFCDTSHEQGVSMTDREIFAAVDSFPREAMVVLTGGEPSLFIDRDFVEALKRRGRKVAIETNGTVPLADNIDWVTFSPKGLFPGGDLQPCVLERCDELKVVYTGQELDGYFSIKADHYFLQPCHCSDEAKTQANIRATIEAVLNDPRWRLSLQTHRLLGIR